jgi:hypothetical protein
MSKQPAPKGETFINIRKLAALDIDFHGSKLILAEFAGTVILSGGLGIFSLFGFFSNPSHPLFTIILGLVLCWIALNFVPLLLYAISIVRQKSAQQEVAFELEHKEIYVRKYTLQSIWLLLLPFLLPILAVYQEIQKKRSPL